MQKGHSTKINDKCGMNPSAKALNQLLYNYCKENGKLSEGQKSNFLNVNAGFRKLANSSNSKIEVIDQIMRKNQSLSLSSVAKIL